MFCFILFGFIFNWWLFGVYFSQGVFIVGAKRTAFGTLGGTFKSVTGTQLQTHACKATLEAAGVRPDQVDSVNIGNVLVVWTVLCKEFFSLVSQSCSYNFQFLFHYMLAFTTRWNFLAQTCIIALWHSNWSTGTWCESIMWVWLPIDC